MGHLEGITFIDSRGDGRYFISNGKDQTIKLWDIRKMASDITWLVCSSSTRCLEFGFNISLPKHQCLLSVSILMSASS